MSSFSHLLLRRSFCTSQPPSSKKFNADATFRKSVTKIIYRERNLRRVVDMFKKASENDRFRTNPAIYVDTISRLAAAKRFRWIEEILEDQKKYKNISKEGFAVRLIYLYGKSTLFDQALKTFDEMPERNCKRTVLSFNALLGACVHSKKFAKLDKIFRETPSKLAVSPDVYSYTILMKGFCEVGSFGLAVSILDEMKENGVASNLVTFNTLLSYLNSHGRVAESEKIWTRMKAANIVPNIKSYNAKLIGFTTTKRMLDAVSLYEEMKAKEIEADVCSFNALIKGFCRDDDVDEAKKWYEKMRAGGFAPDKTSYVTLISAACEKDKFDLVLELCKHVFQQQGSAGAPTLQLAVDGLVKKSKVCQANKLVELLRSNKECRFNLQMPSRSR